MCAARAACRKHYSAQDAGPDYHVKKILLIFTVSKMSFVLFGTVLRVACCVLRCYLHLRWHYYQRANSSEMRNISCVSYSLRPILVVWCLQVCRGVIGRMQIVEPLDRPILAILRLVAGLQRVGRSILNFLITRLLEMYPITMERRGGKSASLNTVEGNFGTKAASDLFGDP